MPKKKTFKTTSKVKTKPTTTAKASTKKEAPVAVAAEITAQPPAKSFQFKSTPTSKETPITSPSRSRFKIWMLLLFCLIGIVITLSLTAWWYISEFEQASGTKVVKLINEVRAGNQLNLFSQQPSFNVLLLGIDSFSASSETGVLTDTILLLSFKQDGRLVMLSLPRDLWIDSLKTKINAIYYYGEENAEASGPALVSSVVEEITGQEIDGHFVINLNAVKAIVDLIGGVEVEVQHAFVDEQYPVENAASPSADRHTTVSFESGRQTLNGDRALQFIRSRQSQDPQEGTDQARAARQQQVVEAMSQTFQNPAYLTQPRLLGQLYAVWLNQVITDMDLSQVIAVAKRFNQQPRVVKLSLPIAAGSHPGLITHPPVNKHDQWVYEPLDPTWESIHSWLAGQGL